MLGSALVRSFIKEGAHLLFASRQELDLENQDAVYDWVEKNRPELVFHVGAKVGGYLRKYQCSLRFFIQNLMIQSNVIDAAHHFGVEKLIFVASNCTYPAAAAQPIAENPADRSA